MSGGGTGLMSGGGLSIGSGGGISGRGGFARGISGCWGCSITFSFGATSLPSVENPANPSH
jgi:hypothetical protein